MVGVVITSEGERVDGSGAEEKKSGEELQDTPTPPTSHKSTTTSQPGQHYHVIALSTTRVHYCRYPPSTASAVNIHPIPLKQCRNIDGCEKCSILKKKKKKREKEGEKKPTCTDIDVALTYRPVQILMRRGSISLRNANKLWMPKR